MGVIEAKAVGLGDDWSTSPTRCPADDATRSHRPGIGKQPAVILADEATGNLDTRTSFEILVLFQKLHAEGRTIIFVTHNPEMANIAAATSYCATDK